MSDGDGGIGDIAGDVAGSIWGEVKKLGSSATSQVSGSAPTPSADDVKAAQKSQAEADSKVQDSSEFKKLGQSILGQITGHQEPEQNLEQMKKTDEDFSSREAAAVRAKIKAMYDQYAAKRAQLDQREAAVEKREEEVKEEKKEVKKEQLANRAIEQTRAENKNYGAE
ncbi:MAG TPA: hypothetical protein VLE91_01795 [Candidatus Saccharimonadales bacterium]|nr:hypothetical protein [Candidatus Saccharimonadales bacterium]